ncbi:hypothetical protein E8E11_002354 [Didymella keratinophila]|nr:hypothetical protein E8E11_002354 [Didymella keratinophila]
MRSSIPILSLLLMSNALAIPLADPSPDVSSLVSSLLGPNNLSSELDKRKADSPGKNGNCPKTVSQNVCTSGAPYCCSGSGASQVCGPASSVACSSMTICCINTNGMQICAGEIDFTGPVTININK